MRRQTNWRKHFSSVVLASLLLWTLMLAACGNPQPTPTPTPSPSINYHWSSPTNGEPIKNTINASVELESNGVVMKIVVFVEQNRKIVSLCTGGEKGTTWTCHGNVKDIQPRLDAGNIDVFFTAYNAQGQPVLSKSSIVEVKYIEPGGYWISPLQGPLHRIVHFSARAFRTFPSEPILDHVNFTVYSQGWQIACTVSAPGAGPNKNIFSCDADFQALGVIPGQVIVSFDAYERGGYYNLSPNGEHTFQYAP